MKNYKQIEARNKIEEIAYLLLVNLGFSQEVHIYLKHSVAACNLSHGNMHIACPS